MSLPSPDSSGSDPRREVHGSVLRENEEPRSKRPPLPLWLTAVFCLALAWAGWYWVANSGGFRPDVFDPDVLPSASNAKPVDPIALGRRLYSINCSQCHQPSGLGVPGQYPPLAGSEIVQSRQAWGPNHVVMIVLGGLQGPITVRGNTYDLTMPTHRNTLKDEQIAVILTYIRQEWGNQASPISQEAVAAIRQEMESRKQPWTEAELKAVPAKDFPTPRPLDGIPGQQDTMKAVSP